MFIVAVLFSLEFPYLTDSETNMQILKMAGFIAIIAACGLFGAWWRQAPSVPTQFAHAECDHLVIRCMDLRIRPITDKWIAKTLGDHADVLAWPGVTPGFHEDSIGEWMLDAIRTAQRLHGIRVVHLVSHQDCGGHGGWTKHESLDAEKEYHRKNLEQTADLLREHLPDLTIHCYYVDPKGVHPF